MVTLNYYVYTFRSHNEVMDIRSCWHARYLAVFFYYSSRSYHFYVNHLFKQYATTISTSIKQNGFLYSIYFLQNIIQYSFVEFKHPVGSPKNFWDNVRTIVITVTQQGLPTQQIVSSSITNQISCWLHTDNTT